MIDLLIGFVVWRLWLFLAAWAGGHLLLYSPRFPYSDVFLFPSGFPHWVWSFANFDGVHYLTIARQGYTAQYTQVFFPLFPLVIRYLHIMIPSMSDLLIGIVFSSFCFFLSLIVFKRLMEVDGIGKSYRWAIVMLLTFPTSFYFGAIYTESMFFLLVLSSFYFTRKRQYILSACLAGLASATRVVGIALLPSLLIEIWYQYVSSSTSAEKFHLKKIGLLYILLSPLGLISYMVYLYQNFHDPLFFWHAQPVFGAQRSGSSIVLLPQVVWRYTKMLTSLSLWSEVWGITALECFSLFLCLFLLYLGYRKKIRISYLFFSCVCVIIPTLTGTLSSMPRYVLISFPMYITLAMETKMWVKYMIVFIFLILEAILTILFTRGHWVS